MKTLVLAVAALGLISFAGVTHAGAGCSGSMKHEQTAETPPPPPPPNPSS